MDCSREYRGSGIERIVGPAEVFQLPAPNFAISGQIAGLAIEAAPDASARVLVQLASARAYVSGLAQHFDELGEHHSVNNSSVLALHQKGSVQD